MRAEQKKQNRHYQQKLFRRCILIPVVDLLPHVQVVVGAGVELEGYTLHPMEHQVGAEHVGHVRERPRGFLGDAGKGVEEDFESDYEDYMDCPGTYRALSIPLNAVRGYGVMICSGLGPTS